MSLKAEYELLKNQKDEGYELLEEVVNSIKNLRNLFENGDYEMKTMLLGSILNGRVYISKNECRTTEMNRVVELISKINKDFKTIVHKKTVISDGLSTVAPLIEDRCNYNPLSDYVILHKTWYVKSK